MRDPWPEMLERCRVTDGEWSSERGDRHGAFLVQRSLFDVALDQVDGELRIIANAAVRDSAWWEHVSVSTPDRCPTWTEMCFVKDLFWSEDELVVQFHPRKVDYVNFHPRTLHLWRPTRHKDRMPTPPTHLVGPK
jgi:hypothetical protein